MYIETDRLILKKLRSEDAAELFKYRSDPDVYKYQTWLPETIDDARKFIDSFPINSEWIPGQWKQVGIYLKENEKLIGDIGIFFRDRLEVELGFTVSPAHQRQGYANEAVTAIVNTLAVEWQVNKFIGITDPENIASISLLEKLGFELTEHKIKSTEIRGELKDDLVFTLQM